MTFMTPLPSGSGRDEAPAGLELAIAETRAWLDQAVIGLNLCPFAKAPRRAGRIRIEASGATEPQDLLADLAAEMQRLVDTDPSTLETTLLVHPRALLDFLDYNDFLDLADEALEALDLAGVLQIASFHPDYRFDGTEADDIGNATNRSPYPTLQLLREASVERAVGAAMDDDDLAGPADAIIEANLQTLAALGASGWAALQAGCRREAVEALARGSAADSADASPPPSPSSSRFPRKTP